MSNETSHRERVAIQRQQLTKAFALQQRTIEHQQRILDLLDLHDLKDTLVARGISAAHLERVGEDEVVVVDLLDVQERRMDDSIAEQAFTEPKLGFAKLAIQDVGYEPGDSFIVFDATGDPGDLSRGDLEDRLTQLHAHVFPNSEGK